MILPVGKILRFRGPNAELELETAKLELNGACRREGNTLVLTRPKKIFFVDDREGAHFASEPTGNGA
jgi:hypothetical protein